MARTITASQLEEIADQVDGTVRDDYSGRGMYGKTCFGIVADNSVLLGAALIITLGEDLGLQMAEKTVTDSMGRSTIFYWPGWTVAEEV